MSSTIWQILDAMRSGNGEFSSKRLIERLATADPKPTPSDLWRLCGQLREKSAGEPANQRSDPFGIFSGLFGQASTFGSFFGGHGLQEPLSRIVTDFALDYLTPLRPKRLLNPWTDEPVVVSALLNTLPSFQEACAVSHDGQSDWKARLFGEMAAKLLGWNKAAEWRVGKEAEKPKGPENAIFAFGRKPASNPVRALAELNGDWDTIICFPPIGGGVDAALLVAESASRLSRNGVGLFVVPPAFFAPSRSVTVYNVLRRYNLSLEAALSIPPEHRGSMLGVDLALIAIKKGVQGPLFVGELQSDPSRRKVLLKNLELKQEARDFALGMLVEKEGFRSYRAVKTAREYLTQLTRQGVPQVNLADLLEEANASRRNAAPAFPDRANAVYLPSVGFSEAVTSTEHFRIKPQNYLQLVLKPNVVSAEFLANFLNSDLGIQARRCLSSGSYVSKISLGAVREGVQIPLPPLKLQSEVIASDTRLRDLASDIENLRKQLWNRPVQVEKTNKAIKKINGNESFEEWLKCMPFPLASILWNYHAANHEPKEQFELLLKFFEGLAEFIATILLSAAKRDAELWCDVRNYLTKERERFETSSFGTWIELTAFIGKRLRGLWNDAGSAQAGDTLPGRVRCEAALGTSRSEVVDAVASKDLLGVLRHANQFRNDYGGHYGVLGEETAANLLVQLRSFLSKARCSLDQVWENYQLLLPTDRSKWTGQHHEVIVHILQGTNTPFVREKRMLREPLKWNTLYLLDKDSDNPVELLPLVKISHAPQSAANACYFYNRKQADGARYVSYHFEKEAHLTFANSELKELFGDLFGS